MTDFVFQGHVDCLLYYVAGIIFCILHIHQMLWHTMIQILCQFVVLNENSLGFTLRQTFNVPKIYCISTICVKGKLHSKRIHINQYRICDRYI